MFLLKCLWLETAYFVLFSYHRVKILCLYVNYVLFLKYLYMFLVSEC